jgi:predicted DNA-binding WGR domain protein
MSNVRRFYFDDGSSRKRWHVEVKGKSQLVAYGRLTGTLRESTKSFKSPAEAATETEKLIAKKKREGYIEVNPARLRILRKKGQKKATDQQIKALEKQLGHTLPDEYRNFLKTVNGGRPNPDFIQLFGVPGSGGRAVETLFHLKPAKPEYHQVSFQIEAWGDVLEAHVPVAEGDGDVITLSLEPKTYSAVYWWSHEVDEPGHLLASSFDEFLTRIAVADGDVEESEEETSAEGGAAKKESKSTVRGLLKLVRHDHTPETIKEMEQMVKELGDLSGIADGKWPFVNIDSPRLVRCLLEAGLNPEITDSEGHSLLWQCAGSRECVDLLAEYGVRIDRRSGGSFETALMRAAFCGEIAAVERLLHLGANPTVRRLNLDGRLENPSTKAELRKLIDKASAQWRKNGGWRKKAEEARARRAAANAEGRNGGPKPTIGQLLQRMDRPYISDECNDVEELEALIEAISDLSGIEDGQWPKISTFESPRLLNALLEAGLNPEILDKEGISLLGRCVVHPECIELLVERGVEVDRRCGKENETALVQAIFGGDADCLEALLAAGANPTVELDFLAKMYLENSDAKTRVLEAARKNWAGKKANKPKK